MRSFPKELVAYFQNKNMEFITTNITFVVTTLTLISNIVFVLGVIAIFAHNGLRGVVYSFVNKYVLEILLVVSLSAIVGSLAYSNIIGFPPCELCWIQRIFMFPIPLMVILAMFRKDKNVVPYVTLLASTGLIVALYHSLSNWGYGAGALPCTAAGGECSKLYVLEYGYITIPFMALTIFIYLITVSILYSKSKNVGE